ncbi:uncharacterized protein LOC120541112 isoform X1 [Polypterus senegalus]|uniref:uncharacterized protein LOC120541112 isoform X1 n=1 Tax=Polypterus senegalus TaxID=55291 RepID=UPI0019649F17|nr:uncharacterized protein LOC120541112 isoform X1 [Polypterus senegalus]
MHCTHSTFAQLGFLFLVLRQRGLISALASSVVIVVSAAITMTDLYENVGFHQKPEGKYSAAAAHCDASDLHSDYRSDPRDRTEDRSERSAVSATTRQERGCAGSCPKSTVLLYVLTSLSVLLWTILLAIFCVQDSYTSSAISLMQEDIAKLKSADFQAALNSSAIIDSISSEKRANSLSFRQIREKVEVLNAAASRRVYFFTLYTGTLTGKVDPIKFNQVLLNIGGAYSSSSGRFTCAYSGVHQFFFSANSQQKVPTELCLMVNSWCKVMSKADPDKNSTGNMGMALLELQKGNTVWVSQVTGGSWANATFGGMLL